MLQQVMTKPGEIIFREVPVPELKDDEVLVKIMNISRLNLLIFLKVKIHIMHLSKVHFMTGEMEADTIKCLLKVGF